MTDLTIKTSSQEKEYILLHSLVKELNRKIELTDNKIKTAVQELEEEVPIYINNLKLLSSEIEELRNQLQLKNINQTKNYIEEDRIKLKDEPDDIKIKQLYMGIASKCHPDKTKNEELHELFIIAKEAYKNHNYTKLLEIYNNLKNNLNNTNDIKPIDIEDQLKIIKDEFNILKKKYESILNSKGYVISELLLQDDKKMQARKLFMELLINQSIELEKLKNQLKSNLNSKESFS